MQSPTPALNRALRRSLAREQRRPKRAERPLAANTIQLAIAGAGRLTADEVANATKAAVAGFQALREGVATVDQWDAVDSAVLVALTIEEQGVVRGLAPHFEAAARALAEIRRRVEQAEGGPAWGRRTTLYFQEIEAVGAAIELHRFQMQQLSFGELCNASNRAIAKFRGRGVDNLRAVDTLTQPTQEKLL